MKNRFKENKPKRKKIKPMKRLKAYKSKSYTKNSLFEKSRIFKSNSLKKEILSVYKQILEYNKLKFIKSNEKAIYMKKKLLKLMNSKLNKIQDNWLFK